jgi:hypothetical protein
MCATTSSEPRESYLFVFVVSALASHLERVMGIEPTSKAWEAFILPLNYTRARADFTPDAVAVHFRARHARMGTEKGVDQTQRSV